MIFFDAFASTFRKSRVNLRHLETFYWIARLGSFTAAAQRLLSTQSTVSSRIRDLEQSLGVRLFDRDRRSARLTPKGKELVLYAERLLELTHEMQQRITPSESVTGLIRVGVVEIIAYTWLPQFIRALRLTYPNIALELEIALTAELMEKLVNGSLDVVFALGNPPSANYVSEPLGSIQLEWMAHPELGLPARAVAPKTLEQFPFITLNRHSYHHATIQSWMKQNQVRCRKVIVCNSLMVAANLVSAGVGISLLPPACYAREMEQGTLRIVRTTAAMPPVHFAGIYPLDEFQPLAPLVTELAVKVSQQDPQARGKARARRAPTRA
jgi:DNA-binding transcriptional LysR family regulator